MIRKTRLACLTLLTLACSAGITAATNAANTNASNDPLKSGAIEALVERLMEENRVPGVALAIIEGDELTYFRGFGRAGAGDQPPNLETPFLIGSLSKSFTALVLVTLAEDGFLDLDEPVHRYLAWFSSADRDAWRQVTVRHLLHQSSGIDRRTDRSFVAESRRERALAVLRSRPASEPGHQFHYANPNYMLLELIAESVSGRKFGDLLDERVFSPLGMSHSGVDLHRAPRLAVGHQLWFGWPVARSSPLQSGLGEGGVISTADDMARYLSALTHGGRLADQQVLSASAVATVVAPGIRIDDDRSYAMGWYRRPLSGLPSISHGGSTPGYSSFVAHFPEQKRTIVVLTNSWGAIFGGRAPIWITLDIARLLDDRAPLERKGAVAKYRWLNLLLLLAVALEMRGWFQLRRFRAQLAERSTAAARFRYGVPRSLSHILRSIGLLVVIPWYVALPLLAFFSISFDLGWVLLVSAILGLAKGIVQLAMTLSS